MTRKQLLKKLQEEIPHDLSDIEKAFYIAIFLSKHVSFDEHYYFGSSEQQEKIYKLAQQDMKQNNENDKKDYKRNLTCITISSLYGYLAENMGLEVSYMATPENVRYKDIYPISAKEVASLNPSDLSHVVPLVTVKNERGALRTYKMDVQNDLSRLQMGETTRSLGTKNNNEHQIDSLEQYEITKILRKIGYVEGNKYLDDILANMMVRNRGLSDTKKFELIMSNSPVRGRLQNCGVVEAYKAMNRIINNYCRKESRTYLETFQLRRNIGSEENKKISYSFGIYSHERDYYEKATDKVFVFSKKDRRLVEMPEEVLSTFFKSPKTHIHDFVHAMHLTRYLERLNILSKDKVDKCKISDEYFIDDEEMK